MTTTVTPSQDTRIRSTAERNAARWAAELETARRDGRTGQIPGIERTLAFWTRTAARTHTGRTIH